MTTVRVEWHNDEQTRLVWTFARDWTEQDFDAALALTRHYMANSPHLVDAVVDFRHARVSAKAVSSLMRSALANSTERAGRVVIVTHARFAETVYDVVRHLYGNRVHERVFFVTTLAEAEALLSQTASNGH